MGDVACRPEGANSSYGFPNGRPFLRLTAHIWKSLPASLK